ncbi:hypothetical protein [Actinomadura madurae]|uniref:hypothetical protein n=1 Tax=Actinomadura madurae TaxID=1993 RepID=UPI0015EF55C9|nr:hypothetical protein [Actinomadura madurae]
MTTLLDDGCGQGLEGLVDVVADLPADAQAAGPARQADGALDGVAVDDQRDPCGLPRRVMTGLMPLVHTSRLYLSWS